MGRWLKLIRAQYDLGQDELAAHIGKSRSAVAMYERGSPIPPDTVALIRTTFTDAPPPPISLGDIEPKGLVTEATSLALIRYAGTVPASSEWGDPLSSDDLRPVDPKFCGPKRYMCKVSGDSCFPALEPGDMTIWEKDYDAPFGVIVLAERIGDQACTVKQLDYDRNIGRPVLKPVNPESNAPPEDQGWRVVARLVAVIRTADGPERTWYYPNGLRPRHLLP